MLISSYKDFVTAINNTKCDMFVNEEVYYAMRFSESGIMMLTTLCICWEHKITEFKNENDEVFYATSDLHIYINKRTTV